MRTLLHCQNFQGERLEARAERLAVILDKVDTKLVTETFNAEQVVTEPEDICQEKTLYVCDMILKFIR